MFMLCPFKFRKTLIFISLADMLILCPNFILRHRDEVKAKATELMKKGDTTAVNKLLAGSAKISYAMTIEFIRVSCGMLLY